MVGRKKTKGTGRLSFGGLKGEKLAGRLRKIRKLFQQREKVQNTAGCARALAAMIGRHPKVEMTETAHLSRAMLTARVIKTCGNIPWPASISRELDVEDPAFLPPLGAHLPLSARDATALGYTGQPQALWVDPWGWSGLINGPMVTVWFGIDNDSFLVGKLPHERKRV